MRLLHARGYSPEVFLLGSSTNLQGEPALFLRMLQSVGVPTRFLQHEADWAAYQHSVAAADVLVDALLGTGFTGTLRPEAARAITDMNQGTGTRIAVDIPSGLYADTGHIETVAIRAHMTVTFAAAKQGFFTQQGREHLGELVVDPIALPPQLLTETLIP
jgi:ADP-dependent NAD(P)H-hydrate dehydratase / NAD(P)H-hydrate epimerase